jgi:cysteine synthase
MSHPAPPLSNSIIETIGNTPMVELHRMKAKLGFEGRLLAKLEFFNPGFSKKDRIALEIVREAKQQGILKDGQTVVELTSGNTGTGLAITCKALGHPFIAVISKGNTMERVRMMRALGAEVVLVDQASGSPPNQVSGEDLALVETMAQKIQRERNAFRADQFKREANSLAHERHTGPEIWEQSQGKVDVFLDFVGSGGSFNGVATFLRQKNKNLRSYVIEPIGAAVLAGKNISQPNHKIQGGGYSMKDLPLLNHSLVTDYLQVTDDEALNGARTLAAEEGIFGGFSSGANFSAALKLIQDREKGATICFLVPDSGLKYLSTDLY